MMLQGYSKDLEKPEPTFLSLSLSLSLSLLDAEDTNRPYWQNSATRVKTYSDPHLTDGQGQDHGTTAVDDTSASASGTSTGTATASAPPSKGGGNVSQTPKPTVQAAAHATALPSPSHSHSHASSAVGSVIHSINVILSKNKVVLRFADDSTARTQALLEAYVPVALQYLPDKKVGKEFIFLLASILVLSVLLYSCAGAGTLLVNVAGLLYPMYATMHAVEDMQKGESKQWLSYWIIYMGVYLAHDTMWIICQFIPLYSVIKLFFLVWLYHPQSYGASTLYGLAQPHISKLLRLLPSPPLAAQSASAKEALLAKATSKISGSSSSSSGSQSTETAQKSHLVVVVKKVIVPAEKNIYVECTVLPKGGRAAEGIEGTCYKTNKILGKTCVFNHSNTFLPLPVLDGVLHLDLCEKPTFSEAVSLGSTDISLLELVPGAAAVERTVLVGKGIELVLGLELGLGEP